MKKGMPKPLPHGVGRQMITVYRGLNNTSFEDLNTSNLGLHWTPDKEKAMPWITGADKEDESQKAGFAGTSGVLIEGTTHRRNIETNPKKLRKAGSFGINSREKEFTVKSGRKVKVYKVSKYKVKENRDSYNTAKLEETQEFKKPIVSKVSKGKV